jgi:hypothetical protein
MVYRAGLCSRFSGRGGAGLEQDRFGLKRFASAATWRPKRESCSAYRVEIEIHVSDRSKKLRSETILL